jgi:hypothetical protein
MATSRTKQTDWADIIDEIRPFVVKIMTPDGSGTGFLIAHTKTKSIVGIATAAHVISSAYLWHQPIRIRHAVSGEQVFLEEDDRAIWVDFDRDAASIVFSKGKMPFPDEPLELMEQKHHLKIGKEVGWIGFPAIDSARLCFFSGRTSCWLQDEKSYFVDGVAINGVRGGPVFFRYPDGKTRFIGLVSAYVPNQATGTTLPGLCIVRDVEFYYDTIKRLADLAEAKEEAPTPPEPKQSNPPNPPIS